MTALTLIQQKKILKSFFENHAQVNTTLYGDKFDMIAKRDIVYPLSNIWYQTSVINNNVHTFNYRITLADLMDDNVEGIDDEIISDMLQVGEDFLTWLQNHESFVFTKNTNIVHFVNDTPDRVAGIEFTISINMIRLQSNCGTPTVD